MGNDNNIEIRPKFQGLIPRLAKHELAKLEASIINEGVREPLTVATFVSEKADAAPRVLIDGHHRYEIAKKHGLPFGIRDVEFEDEDAAVVWAIDNQIGRRNVLHVLDQVILVEKKRPILEGQARARQLSGKADDGPDLAGKVPQGASTSKKRHPTVTERLAAELKVSRNFYDDCLLILAQAIPAMVKFIRDGDLSVTGAAKLLRHAPHDRYNMADAEHQKWQQELVDNVRGDPDAMQAVIRRINREKREFERMRQRDAAEAAEAKRKEEEYQDTERQDEQEIAKWREAEEQEAFEEEQEAAPEVEEEEEQTEVAPKREEEEEEEQEAPQEQEEEETEQTATVTEIPRPPKSGRNIPEIVATIIDATRDILAARGLGISADGERILGDAVEAWAIKYADRAYYRGKQAS